MGKYLCLREGPFGTVQRCVARAGRDLQEGIGLIAHGDRDVLAAVREAACDGQAEGMRRDDLHRMQGLGRSRR